MGWVKLKELKMSKIDDGFDIVRANNIRTLISTIIQDSIKAPNANIIYENDDGKIKILANKGLIVEFHMDEIRQSQEKYEHIFGQLKLISTSMEQRL